MAHDAQTYRRATNAAILGLATQAGLFVAFGLLGLYAESGAINALAWHTLAGLPVWVILIVFYYQQRLEREEALEAERMSRSDVRAAALFEEAGANLQLARQRLEWLSKWGLTIVSILTAVVMLIIGPVFLYDHYVRFSTDSIEPWVRGDLSHGLLIILLAAFGFVAFLVGRFVSGMTKTDAWVELRGGAGTMLGVVFLALLGIVAALVHLLGFEPAFAWLAIAVPGVTTLLGLEIVASLVLGVYQPRRPGAFRRPAFDSRLLGWMSSPESIGKIVSETLAYQFGFDFSRSYAYRQVMKMLTPMFAVGVLALFAMTCVVVVQPHQEAVVTRFGALVTDEEPLKAGLHFKLPWPISQIHRHDVYRVSELMVGSSADAKRFRDRAILWTNEHVEGGDETYLVTAPSRFPDQPQAEDVVAGELMGGDILVKYRIRPGGGLIEYVGSAADPKGLFKSVVAGEVNEFFSTHQVDDLLRAYRLSASGTLRASMQAKADELSLGIEVLSVSVISMHPPQKGEVADSFHDQINAVQESRSELNRAERDAMTTLAEVAGSREKAMDIDSAILELERLRLETAETGVDRSEAIAVQSALIEERVSEAGGQAAQLIAQARAFRWTFAVQELAKSEQFVAEIAAYERAPAYFKTRRYYEALKAGLKNRPKIVMTDPASEAEGDARVLQLDLTEARTGLESILGN
ncbi:SPFH domain-containing protein [Mucisphaera calidilacus]|uniref:SPFH domain / Band 7 family protein n=1 Tax=Mucisphaera calidilacus TaxID=2527982 RepID=A0A518C0K3_9BACT|nr:SPFH domain-containing protein [Mucisphaera calidilacus]QDU72755.1 SPFH domain / Band 7 family protein [Mucisphaera calidilacus]